MPIIERIAAFHNEMTAWRHDLHAHPELCYEEHRTADLVAAKLTSFGCDAVTRGVGRTGVVATIRAGTSPRAIGLRADMDALPLTELNEFTHRSCHPGKMHACGHDGHTAMLLGTARYLAETRAFDGTAYLIFQPAEEGGAGAKAMIDDGLFERFPVDAVYSLHNRSGLPVGRFLARSGPTMASVDTFDIVLTGKGAHSARPELGIDPIVAAAQTVMALQTIVARQVAALDSAVVSVTQIVGGEAYNIIPEQVTLRGTIRSYRPETRLRLKRRIREIAEATATACGATAQVVIGDGYPALVNHERETRVAADAAAEIVGEANVDRTAEPTMASEDFSYMLEARPGAHLFVGNGEGREHVHHPRYDFNDAVLPFGASYFARLVERELPQRI